MPAVERTHRVEVYTAGDLTLDELEQLCVEARRAHVPGSAVARVAAVQGAGANVGFVHDFPTGPAVADAVTEQFATPVRRPSIGNLR